MATDHAPPRAQRLHGFAVETLPQFSTLAGNSYDEALHDNTQTPPPEQAAFRCDFPAWCRTRSHRDRKVIDDLLLGGRGLDVARAHGLTPARISQLRREFHEDWSRFCGDEIT